MGVDALVSVETAGGAWQPASAAATRPSVDASRTPCGRDADTAKEERIVMVLESGAQR